MEENHNKLINKILRTMGLPCKRTHYTCECTCRRDRETGWSENTPRTPLPCPAGGSWPCKPSADWPDPRSHSLGYLWKYCPRYLVSPLLFPLLVVLHQLHWHAVQAACTSIGIPSCRLWHIVLLPLVACCLLRGRSGNQWGFLMALFFRELWRPPHLCRESPKNRVSLYYQIACFDFQMQYPFITKMIHFIP